jgi:hypothetical protein
MSSGKFELIIFSRFCFLLSFMFINSDIVFPIADTFLSVLPA